MYKHLPKHVVKTTCKEHLQSQAFTFPYAFGASSKFVIIKNPKSGLVATETAENTVTVNTYKKGDNNQLWKLKPAPNGTVFIVNKVSGQALEKSKDNNLALTKPLCHCEEATTKPTKKPAKASNTGSGGIRDFFNTGSKNVLPKQNECQCKDKPWPISFVEKTINYAENGSIIEAAHSAFKDVTSKKSSCECKDQQLPTDPVETTHSEDNNPEPEKPSCKCEHQQWHILSSEQIITNVDNGRALDIQDGSYEDGNSLIVYRQNGGANQLFITETV